MSADILLSKLKGVKRTANGRWVAKCCAHDDRSPSLAITEKDGRTLVHCFAGCSTHDVLTAAGLTFNDLFDKPLDHSVKSERRAFNANDILSCVAFEALVCAVAASDIARGVAITEVDRERLLVACTRLRSAAEVANRG